MSDIDNLKTEIALLKKDAKTGELIHQRLEVAIEKLGDCAISLKAMLAQQETKLLTRRAAGWYPGVLRDRRLCASPC